MDAETEFEKERLARIARNNEVLKGLSVQQLKPPAASQQPARRSGAKRSASVSGHRQAPNTPQVPVRCSPRIAAQQGSSNNGNGRGGGEVLLPEVGAQHAETSRHKRGSTAALEKLTAVPPKALKKVADAIPGSDDTIRCASAVPWHSLEEWVGKRVLSGRNPPKASAISLLTRGTPEGVPPRFSKYSGVAEMADAVAVFVNLDKGSGEVYDNTFSHGGRQMSWFASSRMQEETPAIQRMLRTLPCTPAAAALGDGKSEQSVNVRQGSEALSASPAGMPEQPCERVFLFLREPGCHYTFCGEVRASGWVPGSRPLQLTWELVRFDELKNKPAFQELLGEQLSP